MTAKHDFVRDALKGKQYCRRFILWPDRWRAYGGRANLDWKCIRYENSSFSRLPRKPGVYAFVVKPGVAKLTCCGYLFYIGMTNKRTLRERCSEYQRDERVHIAAMIQLWGSHLYLYYAALDPNAVDIPKLEIDLIAAFCPPCNIELKADIGPAVREIWRS